MTDSTYNSIRWMRRLAVIGAGAAMALGALAVMVETQPVRVDPRDAIPSVAAGFTLSVPRPGSQAARDAASATEYRIATS
ncbi:hypothetical protein MAUB1S_04708 [Mycolicibacterium aubagnense]